MLRASCGSCGENMDDGKPTGPKAKWWSRPTPGHTTTSAPESAAAAVDAPVEDVRAADTPARPEPVAPAQPVPPEPVTPAQPAAPEPVAPEPVAQAPAAPASPPPAPAAAPAVPATAPAPAAKPLHEPDEYSTPPYGGPGPWAP